MSTATPPPGDDPLYGWLPAVYRMRDAAQGSPLRTLLRAIAGQAGQFTEDIGRLYANWFVETCDEDVLPYFAGLVGLALGPPQPVSAGCVRSGADAAWRRAQVADAISYRSRKGTFSVLAELAATATGWPALAVELRRTALATPTARMPGVAPRHLTGVADAETLDLLGTPLAGAAPLADVRRLTSHRTPGSADPSAVAVWLWRLAAEQVRQAPAASAGEENRYTFDQFGRDLALAVVPVSAPAVPPSSALDVPMPISRPALRLRLEDYYGPGRSICVYRGGMPVPRSDILVADLSRWREPAERGRVSIDPVLGRIAFPARYPPAEQIRVTCAHLGAGAIGGGSYHRPLAVPSAPVYRVGPGGHATIRLALDAWRAACPPAPSAVIEITGDGVYREHLDIRLAAGERLEIRAAQGCRPAIIPVDPDGGRPGRALRPRHRGSRHRRPRHRRPAALHPGRLLDRPALAQPVRRLRPRPAASLHAHSGRCPGWRRGTAGTPAAQPRRAWHALPAVDRLIGDRPDPCGEPGDRFRAAAAADPRLGG